MRRRYCGGCRCPSGLTVSTPRPVTIRPIAWAHGRLVAKGLFDVTYKIVIIIQKSSKLRNYYYGRGSASAHLGCRQQSASEMLARKAVELASSTVHRSAMQMFSNSVNSGVKDTRTSTHPVDNPAVLTGSPIFLNLTINF